MKRTTKIQTITDPALEPFFISRDEHCYTVKEKISPKEHHFRTRGNGTVYAKSLSYFPTFGTALNEIIKLKSSLSDPKDLKDYLKTYELISKQIKNYTDEIRSTF